MSDHEPYYVACPECDDICMECCRLCAGTDHYCPICECPADECDYHEEYDALVLEDADLVALAMSLGYAWPTDDAGQRRVLILMAKTASRWREQVSECQRGIMKEKWYEHLRRRLNAMTKKRKAVRQAAIEYKRGRDFDALCRTRQMEEVCAASLARLENPLLDTSLFDDVKCQLRAALGKREKMEN